MSSTVEQKPETRAAGRFDPQTVARYRRAVDYLAGAQIYLKSNPLLEEPLLAEHVKERLLGHWWTQGRWEAAGPGGVTVFLDRDQRRYESGEVIEGIPAPSPAGV